jgi:hypothetical protein
VVLELGAHAVDEGQLLQAQQRLHEARDRHGRGATLCEPELGHGVNDLTIDSKRKA